MATVQQVADKVMSLQESVQKETDLNAAIITYVQGLQAMLADLKTQLAAAIAAGADPVALQSVVDALDTIQANMNAQAVADATVLNTPAAPPTP